MQKASVCLAVQSGLPHWLQQRQSPLHTQAFSFHNVTFIMQIRESNFNPRGHLED